MNAEKLAKYIDWLLTDEKEFGIQDELELLNKSIESLASSPQETSHQKNVSEYLSSLKAKIIALMGTYDANQWRGVCSIGALPFFSLEMYEEINENIRQNSMTPSVVHQYVNALTKRRGEYIENLRKTRNGLKALSIKPEVMQDEAEVGFQIPREIFRNNLDGLVEELRAIRRIIRAFSEVATKGSPEEIHVRQISTSDPTFYFGLTAITVAQLGFAVTWALDKWKQVEEIRKIRAETKKLKVFSPEEILETFDKKIQSTIKDAIEEKTTSLIGPNGVTGRKAEQRADISWALEALFSRIERGMTVEIKFLPPLQEKKEDGTEEPEPVVFQELRNIKSSLEFPEIERSPILTIPKIPPENDQVKSRKTRQPET